VWTCGMEKESCWRTKAAISLKRVKIEENLLWTAYIETHQRSFERYHPRPPTASPSPKLGGGNLATTLISGTGKATDFKFGGYIYRAYPNKSPLKILETRKLCYRKDDRAMRHIHCCPENFRDSLTTPTATIPNSFQGLSFGSTL